MLNLSHPRLDKNPELRNCLLKYARLKASEVWDDPLGKHRIGPNNKDRKIRDRKIFIVCFYFSVLTSFGYVGE
jgi:hypothetical protein